MTMHLVNSEEDKATSEQLLTYKQWSLSQAVLSPEKAWDHQQKIIDELNTSWEDAVMWGKDQLGETIQKQNQALLKLQKEVNRLTGVNHQLEKEINERQEDQDLTGPGTF